MVIVLPVEVTRTSPHAPVSKAPLRTLRRLMVAGAALLLAAPLLAAAHQARPAPYGDRLTVHARGEHPTKLRTHDRTAKTYNPTTGEIRWRHTHNGQRPLTILPTH
ncbi:hypothetical protein ACTWQJ_47980, partial [Streptomyces sp. KR55]